jgi:hypothetical protein
MCATSNPHKSNLKITLSVIQDCGTKDMFNAFFVPRMRNPWGESRVERAFCLTDLGCEFEDKHA